MIKTDLIASGLLTILGLLTIFVIIPLQVSERTDYGLPPDVFPIVTAGIATALSALLFVLKLREYGKTEEDGGAPIPARSWTLLAGMSFLLIMVLIGIQYLGFLIGGPLTVLVFMLLMGERRPLRLIGVSVLAPAIVYAFFWQIFRIPMPPGELWT